MLIRPRMPPGLGGAFWTAAFVLLCVELTLHSDAIMQRYRSVFAVGRAIDKLDYVETHTPQVLFIGNSRTDNGVDPITLSRVLARPALYSFNLGLPGANLIAYQGIVERLDSLGFLGGKSIHVVVLGLDESALQDEDSLGYVGFLSDRSSLWESGRYADLLRSYQRLWSYNANLRQLREPDKLLRFIEATTREVDPVGGAPADYQGYRAGFGEAQSQDQVERQEKESHQPPSAEMEWFLWRAIETLKARGVQVFVTILPLRDRSSAFFDSGEHAAPYRLLLEKLEQRGVIVLAEPTGYSPSEFINAGHLNDSGAQRYTKELGRQLSEFGVR